MSNYRDKEYMKRADVAALFDVSVFTICAWDKAGRLHPVKMTNRTVRYKRSEIEAFLAAASEGRTNAAQ